MNRAKKVAKKPSYNAPALEKGFDIIEVLASTPDGLTSTEIAQRLGRSLSEIFRVVLVMQRRKWLLKHAGSDRYQLSYQILEMALRASPVRALGIAAAPALYDLALAAIQSCHVVVLAEGTGLVVLQQDSPAHSGFSVRLGARIDLAVSASGRVLLAFSEPKEMEAILATQALRAKELLELRTRMELIRDRGYDMRPSIRSMGVTDISYPIMGLGGRVRAAVTMPFLTVIDGTQRVDLEDARKLVAQASQRISAALGWYSEESAQPVRQS